MQSCFTLLESAEEVAAVTAMVIGAPEAGETEVAEEGVQGVTPEVAQAEEVLPGEAILVEEEGDKT